jgi:hypothetical protein
MVQGRSAEWLAQLPVDPKTVPLLAKHMLGGVDVENAQLVVKNFARDTSPGNRTIATEYMVHEIIEGSRFFSVEMARMIPLMLGEDNRGRFESLLKDLPPKSERARLVRSALFPSTASI